MGRLGNRFEPQILENRQAAAERDRLAAMIEPQMELALGIARRSPEFDADLIALAERLDCLDILERGIKVRLVAIARRKGAAPAVNDCRIFSRRPHRLLEAVVPVANGFGDRPFEGAKIGSSLLPGIALDDEMNADQDTLAEGGRKARHLSVESLGQELAHLPPDGAVETVARNEDEGRDEPVELVAAHEQPGARPLLEPEDSMRYILERLGIDLKELIAREILEDGDERLAGMAGR